MYDKIWEGQHGETTSNLFGYAGNLIYGHLDIWRNKFYMYNSSSIDGILLCNKWHLAGSFLVAIIMLLLDGTISSIFIYLQVGNWTLVDWTNVSYIDYTLMEHNLEDYKLFYIYTYICQTHFFLIIHTWDLNFTLGHIVVLVDIVNQTQSLWSAGLI